MIVWEYQCNICKARFYVRNFLESLSCPSCNTRKIKKIWIVFLDNSFSKKRCQSNCEFCKKCLLVKKNK